MKPRGVTLINQKEPLLRQLVFELRYRGGYTYLDKCGRILNLITHDYPEWVIGNEITPQNAPLYSLTNGCRFDFSSTRLGLNLDKTVGDAVAPEEANEFVEQIGALSQTIIDELSLKEFTRMGIRGFYFFPCDSKEDSEKWLAELGMFTVSPQVNSAFGQSLEAASFAVVLSGEDCRYRVATNGVEITAQLNIGAEILSVRASSLREGQSKHLAKQLDIERQMRINPGFAAVIDVDAFHEDPPSVNPREFSKRNLDVFLDKIRVAASSNKT